MREGSPLKNQTCEQGLARSMWPKPFAANFGLGDFDAALVADHAAVLHSLVFSAQAFPIGDRAENSRAEQPVALRLEGAVVDRLRLGHFAVRPLPDLFRRRQTDTNRFEVWSELRFFLLESKHLNILRFEFSNSGFRSRIEVQEPYCTESVICNPNILLLILLPRR